MIWLSLLLCLLAALIMLIAAMGLIRLPDALSRQHAATKASTLAISFWIFGLLLYVIHSDLHWGWILKLLILQLTLLLTMPLASHALARAACKKNPNTDSK